VFKTCKGILETNVVFDEEAFNTTINEITQLSKKSGVTVVDFELISARLQLELIKTMVSRANNFQISSNETLFAKQKILTYTKFNQTLDGVKKANETSETFKNLTKSIIFTNNQSNQTLASLKNNLKIEEENMDEIEKNKINPKRKLNVLDGKNILKGPKIRLLIASKVIFRFF
jgi:hypothetical protein